MADEKENPVDKEVKPETKPEAKPEAKKEEKKETWLTWLAVSTVILAVCATLSTFKGGGFSTRSVMNQSRASDQWSFYQSKSIKGYLYDIQKEKLELELIALRPTAAPAVIQAYEGKIASYSEKTAKYETEKAEIMKKAQEHEAIRDDASLHSGAFGWAVIFLQISILLSSIAALMRKQVIWYVGLVCGAVGVVFFANGFLLFLPF